ncbi:MAG TPA: complex I subunit 5 family protein [Streptosporangiaceae bacterium]|nr:complex I subunit 5 family protein [Streptosporangiaceae bacterium]
MRQLLPLPVVLPLLVAAAVSAAHPFFRARRRVLDGVAIAASSAVAVILGAITLASGNQEQAYWFAGFRPSHGVAIGIDFVGTPLAAGLACLAALLVTAAMVYSWCYFQRVATYYHALMLTFLAGMAGFCLTGDVFDMFVWFELMGVSAFALTAYRPDERGPIQGALAFAITNSIGSYLTLSGIAVIYGRTGALYMAQIGRALSGHRPDGLVIVAFVLIISGLLTKGAIVPFQFWLADAVAVAPVPVGVLFAGVMTELGLYGVARVYWSMFGQAIGYRSAITGIFLVLGLLTAVAGASFSFRERHLKRLIAFAAMSHGGIVLTGIALLTRLGLAGSALAVVGHALLAGALLLCAGLVLHRRASINETLLHGQGRNLPATGVIFALAALGMAGLPPFATYLGTGWVTASAATRGLAWIAVVVAFSSALAGAALLRAAGGVFLGLGDPPAEDRQMAEQASEETSETDQAKQRTPLSMIVPAAALVLAAISLAFVPHLGQGVQYAAVRFADEARYQRTVLSGAAIARPAMSFPPESGSSTARDVLVGACTTVCALVLAGLALYARRLPRLRGLLRPGMALVEPLEGFQSGVVNDYVTWIILGVACIGGVLAYAIR